MGMDKDEVAAVLLEIGTLLELKGENPFKTRAYQNGARILEGLTEPLEKIVAENRLGELKGFGEALQEKVTRLVTTGALPYYDELKASLPPGLPALLEIQGLGPKKVKRLYEELGIDSMEKLEAACQAHQIAALEGFGEKSEAKIIEAIAFKRQFASRHRLIDALVCADPILESLRGHPDVIRCSTAGSLRRWKEVIGDIDFLVSSKCPSSVIEFFVEQPGVKSVLAQGDTKASVIVEGGIQADLRVVTDEEFPFALAYFTGSKEHNIVMRQRAIARGLRLNEYGLFRSSEETRDPALRIVCREEREIFENLGLAYVPPELREDHGEFAAAESHALPRLIEWTDLRGSLHNHSNWSDGRDSLETIAAHAHELGLDYWAITDHSRASFQANGLDTRRLEEQLSAVAAVNASYAAEGSEFRLLTGSEVDILKEGLDFDDSILARLDVVVASLHVPLERCAGEYASTGSGGRKPVRAHARTPHRSAPPRAGCLQTRHPGGVESLRGNGHLDRTQCQSVSIRSRLAALASGQRAWCEVRDQLRCPPLRSLQLSPTGSRHRPEGMAIDRRCH